jgi:hypothetical protein
VEFSVSIASRLESRMTEPSLSTMERR